MDDPSKRSSRPPQSGIPRASRLPMAPPKVPSPSSSSSSISISTSASARTSLRPSPTRETLSPSTLSSPSTDAPRLRPSASSTRLNSSGRLARPLTQAFGSSSGLPVTLAPPSGERTTVGAASSPTASRGTSIPGAAARSRVLRRPSYQQHANRTDSRNSTRTSSTLPDRDVAEANVDPERAAISSGAERDDDDDDDILIPRSLVLTGRRISVSRSASASPERRPVPPRLMTVLPPVSSSTDNASIIPSVDTSSVLSAPVDEDDYLSSLLSPATDPYRSSLSLQDRVIESLQSIAISPSRRGSTFFGGPGSVPQSRPGSRGSRPGSKDGPPPSGWGSMLRSSSSSSRPPSRQSGLLGRPGSSGGPKDRGGGGSGPALRTVSATLRRPLSTIDDSPQPQPLSASTRSVNAPPTRAAASSLRTPTKQTLPRPVPAMTSKLPSPRSLEPSTSSFAAADKKAGYATIGPRTLRGRQPVSPALRRRASANVLDNPQLKLFDAGNRQSVESSASTPSWDGTIASKTSSRTSMSSAGRVTPDVADVPSSRSSLALRDHIAKLRAAKREGVAMSRSSHAARSPSGPEADAAADDTMPPPLAPSIIEDDNLAPWSHRDPFNQSSRSGDSSQKRALKQRIEVGRTTGRLNIAALGLTEIPAEVIKMYDLASIGAYDGTWAESVDLTRLVAADNELETIDNAVFPDRTAEGLMEDEDANGNIFAGLETLDLHGNMLISVPTGLRQLRLLTSLNLTHNRLSNDAMDVITQMTALRNLNLGSNLLYGPLSPAFANLENLEVLDLHGNTVSALPAGIAKMTRLRILNVSENAFQALPFEQLAKLPLAELQARKNKLEGVLIPSAIESMPNLQSLDLSSNQLTHLTAPGTTVKLPFLHQLSLSMNRLRELPDVAQWQSLATLAADDNAITDLPTGFPSLQKLRHADLSNNDIRIIPPEVGRMAGLTMLRITGNPLRDKKFLSITTDRIKDVLASRAEPVSAATPESAPESSTLAAVTPDRVVDAASEAATVDANGIAEDQNAHDECSSDLDDFATPPTSAPASPSRPRAATTTITTHSWPVKPGGILDRSSTESTTLHPVICAKVAAEHSINQAMLHNNAFAVIPECLTFFANTLTSLSLANNKLEADTYLAEPLELPHLRELNLSRNRIESLAPLLSYLMAPRLEKLDISSNRLKALPTNLTPVFPALAVLLASGNHMTDLDPQSIRGLRVVDASRNEIAHLNPRLGLLAAGGPGEGSLERLDVQGNRFRVPRWSILDMGTSVTLRWLRGRIPLAEMADIPGWRDERSNDDDGC